jgi:hypothetical protein
MSILRASGALFGVRRIRACRIRQREVALSRGVQAHGDSADARSVGEQQVGRPLAGDAQHRPGNAASIGEDERARAIGQEPEHHATPIRLVHQGDSRGAVGEHGEVHPRVARGIVNAEPDASVLVELPESAHVPVVVLQHVSVGADFAADLGETAHQRRIEDDRPAQRE